MLGMEMVGENGGNGGSCIVAALFAVFGCGTAVYQVPELPPNPLPGPAGQTKGHSQGLNRRLSPSPTPNAAFLNVLVDPNPPSAPLPPQFPPFPPFTSLFPPFSL